MADLLLQAPIKYEPKTSNRWILRFPTDIGIQTWACVSAGTPKMMLETKEMKFINTSTFVNTSFKWDKQQIVVRDMIAPSQSQALMEWARLHAESVTGRMGYTIGCAKTLNLISLDPTGVEIENWLMENCILSGELEFGEFNYDGEDVRKISFSVQPQRCILVY